MKLKKIVLSILVVFLSTSLAIAMSNNKKDIVDTAIDAGSFDTLVAALEAADLVSTLKGNGPFTANLTKVTGDGRAKIKVVCKTINGNPGQQTLKVEDAAFDFNIGTTS